MATKTTPKSSPKTLARSKSNKVWLGICGGVGEYFNFDPVLIRVVWILIVAFTGFAPGIIAYLLAALVMPESA